MGKTESSAKPLYKKWWFWLIIIIVVIAIAGASASSPQKNGEYSQGQTESAQNEFSVGDIITYDGRDITITSVERNTYTDNQFYKADAGKEFIKVNVIIDNKSDKNISYNTYDWKIQDSEGVIQDVDAGLQYTVDGALDSGELAPGGKKTGDLYFEVPKDDTGLVLHYKPSLWANETINIKL